MFFYISGLIPSVQDRLDWLLCRHFPSSSGPDEHIDECEQEVDEEHRDCSFEVDRKEFLFFVVTFEGLTFGVRPLLSMVNANMGRHISL